MQTTCLPRTPPPQQRPRALPPWISARSACLVHSRPRRRPEAWCAGDATPQAACGSPAVVPPGNKVAGVNSYPSRESWVGADKRGGTVTTVGKRVSRRDVMDGSRRRGGSRPGSHHRVVFRKTPVSHQCQDGQRGAAHKRQNSRSLLCGHRARPSMMEKPSNGCETLSRLYASRRQGGQRNQTRAAESTRRPGELSRIAPPALLQERPGNNLVVNAHRHSLGYPVDACSANRPRGARGARAHADGSPRRRVPGGAAAAAAGDGGPVRLRVLIPAR